MSQEATPSVRDTEATPPSAEPAERSFTLVVAGVLGAAAVLVALVFTAVVWVDSYNTGHSRGQQAREAGIPTSSVDSYCEEIAQDVNTSGSADGYWDLPWLIGCKRGLG